MLPDRGTLTRSGGDGPPAVGKGSTMRSVWKGAISFGLVTIPVKLYRATEQREISFHQVRASDGSRIRYQRVAVADGQEVAYADIAKGYELPSGETVVLTDEDLADLPLASSRAIEVESFVPLEQVDPIYFDKTYYVEPDGTGARKPYALLRQALAGSGRVALVKVALRQREQLATLRTREGLFVLETMLWPDEVREPDFGFLDEPVEIRKQELAMAGSLIDSLSADFHPEEHTDSYREALEALVQAKIDGHQVKRPAGQGKDTGEVVDLMAALRASVQEAQRSRGGGTGDGRPARKAGGGRPAREAGGGAAGEDGTPAPRTSRAKGTAKPPAKAPAPRPAAGAGKPRRAPRKSA